MRNALLLSLALLACNNMPAGQGDMASSTQDMATANPADMTVVSCCGKPGDKGNALGVGHFCRTVQDCINAGAGNPNWKANLCSSLGNKPGRETYFCTIVCDRSDMSVCECGEGAQKECSTEGCACTPTVCVTNPPPGCMR